MTDQAGPRRCECHPGTNFWHPPINVTPFWHPRRGFGALFLEGQKRLYWARGGGNYKTKVVGNGSSYWFVSYGWIYFCLVFQKRKRAPKPLLWCQSLDTSTGGCQNLVPGWHSQRRGPACSVIYPPCLASSIKNIKSQAIIFPFQLKFDLYLNFDEFWKY